jgi:hypothetical protein
VNRTSALRSAFVGVVAVACAVRYVAWVKLGGPITAVDSITYRAFAQSIAHGDFSEIARLPFYLLYPLTLSPLYAFSLPEPIYIEWLHIAASTATVWLIARAAARLVSEKAGLLAGVVAVVYPSFLFWLPYVLTETLFLLCLAVFVHAALRLLERPGARTAGWYLLAALVFSLSRPSAVVCAAFASLALAAALASRRLGAARAIATVALVAALAGAAAAAAIAASPSARNRVLSMPFIGETLWASTRYSTGTIEELRAFEALDQQVHARFQGPTRERDEYAFKVRDAADFIEHHPVAYAGIASRKMVAYWFPWLFATSWSTSHRALDAVVSIGLTVAVFMSLKRRAMAPWPVAVLIAMAAAFILLSAFGQVDPDARYRLPAELLALILAAGASQK